MENVIAIGIVAILLTTFLAVFGPAAHGIRKAISVQEADRLFSALDREMQILRPDTDDQYNSAFEKAFDWIQTSGSDGEEIFLYNYKGDPKNLRADQTMQAYNLPNGEPGKDYIMQPSVRRASDDYLEEDLDVLEGPVYYAKLRQLIFENDALTLAPEGTLQDPHSGTPVSRADDYKEGVITFSVEFFLLPSNSKQFVKNFDPTDEEALGNPLFSRNLAIYRK